MGARYLRIPLKFLQNVYLLAGADLVSHIHKDVADVPRYFGVNVNLLEGPEFSGESDGVCQRSAADYYDRSDPLPLDFFGVRVTKRIFYEQREREHHDERSYHANHYVFASEIHFFIQDLHDCKP